MAKNFKELRDKMSLEAQKSADKKTRAMLLEYMVDELKTALDDQISTVTLTPAEMQLTIEVLEKELNLLQ